jgi:hypothetical protein
VVGKLLRVPAVLPEPVAWVWAARLVHPMAVTVAVLAAVVECLVGCVRVGAGSVTAGTDRFRYVMRTFSFGTYIRHNAVVVPNWV